MSELLQLLSDSFGGYGTEVAAIVIAAGWLILGRQRNNIHDRELELKMQTAYMQQSTQDREDVRRLRDMLDETNRQLSQMKLDVASAQADNRRLTESYSTLKSISDKNATERDALEVELKDIMKERDTLRDEVRDLKQSVMLLKTRLDEFESDRDRYLIELGKERDARERAEKERDALLKEVERLKQQLDAAKGAQESLQKEVTELRARIDALGIENGVSHDAKDNHSF